MRRNAPGYQGVVDSCVWRAGAYGPRQFNLRLSLIQYSFLGVQRCGPKR